MINIKKGLRLAVAGEPVQEQAIEAARPVRSVAVLGDDYPGMKPTMAVAAGDTVAKGQVLFTDKKTDGVLYTAPMSGTISSINRGAKRALQSVVIEVAEGDERTFTQYSAADIATLDGEQVVGQLVDSGVWTSLRTRPFAKVPDPETRPHSIFVTAMDTNPLAADPSVIIPEYAHEFTSGLNLLAKLTDGPVFVCHEQGKPLPIGDPTGSATSSPTGTPNSSPTNKDARIVAHEFGGPHPAGLAGTHIHFLDPVSASKTVWYINYQDVIAVGALFLTGHIMSERVIALAGPGVIRPRLLKTVCGANLQELTAGELEPDEHRIISGSILAGRSAVSPEDFLGRYHLQVSVLPEDKQRRLFGYLSPGVARHSVFPIYLSHWLGKKWLGEKRLQFNTSTNGSPRGMVPVGSYEEVMPLDILATQLLRSLLVGDLENAINLGCLELDEEDISLCTYACPSKYEYGPILRDVLTQIEKEG